MNANLRETYRALADDAWDYVDADRAIRVARRRRRAAASVWSAVAVLALAGTAGVVAATRGGGRPVAPAQPPTAVAPAGALPRRITPPAQAEPLPADRAGRGALLYRACATCPTHLVLGSGSQVVLPDPPGGSAIDSATLSPDGRTLGARRDGGYEVRRLTGTDTHRVAGADVEPVAWAPGSQYLLLRSGTGYVLLDVRTGARSDYHPPAGTRPVAVLGSGDPLVAEVSPDGTRVTRLSAKAYRVSDGALSAENDIDLGSSLRADESLRGPHGVPTAWYVGSDGHTFYVPAYRGGEITAVLQVAVAGLVLGRIELPADPGRPWRALGAYDGGVWLAHEPATGGVDLVRATPASRSTESTLPGGSRSRPPAATTG
jgi:hypothetical protein